MAGEIAWVCAPKRARDFSLGWANLRPSLISPRTTWTYGQETNPRYLYHLQSRPPDEDRRWQRRRL